jgi:hypothetical protein
MFAVVDRVEWRRVLETTVRGTPAVMEIVAARWRRSWTVVRETPAFAARSWKWLRTYSGWSGRPLGWWKTYPCGGWIVLWARLRSAVSTRGDRATQALLLRVLGVVRMSLLLSMVESVQRT